MNQTTSLIILAGGKSSRMGQPKGLLKHNTIFWILSQIETFIGTEIYIGLGYDKQLYFNTIPWLKKAVNNFVSYKNKKVKVIINPNPELGPFSNIQSVLKHVNINHQVLILPIDVPLFNANEQEKLITNRSSIVIPKYQEKKGHPIKLTSKFWQSILSIHLKNEDARLDYQIKKVNPSEISFSETSDGLCTLNLNTPKDWQEFISN